MTPFHSLTCIPHLWDKLVGTFIIPKKTVRALPLPDDIIVEILSRLTADEVLKCRKVCRKWRALTSTANFAEKHVGRATSICLLQCTNFTPKLGLFFLDKGAKKCTMIRKMCTKPTNIKPPEYPVLSGCCNGLLLFNIDLLTTNFLVCNPFTGEQLMLRKPSWGGLVCGIFFHSLTREYRVLFMYGVVKEICFRYAIYSLGGKVWRPLGKFAYRPKPRYAPVIMNQALHWIVMDDDEYKNKSEIPPCANTIMMFNMDTEEFQAMPHPGNVCRYCRQGRHENMQLLEMDGQLSICHWNTNIMNIWVLEEYANWVWVRRYEVSLERDLKLYPFACSVYGELKPINIQGGELLLLWSSRGLFQYHLELNTVRKVDSKRAGKRIISIFDWFSATNYTKSFVSLRDFTVDDELK